jgi:hypothetical protein
MLLNYIAFSCVVLIPIVLVIAYKIKKRKVPEKTHAKRIF